MKLLPSLTVCLFAVGFAVPARAQAPKTQREKLGYALGAEIGGAFKEKGVDFDLAAFSAGVRDTMSGNRPQMTASQRQEMLMSLNKGNATAPTKPVTADLAVTEKNKREGEAFLAANRVKPGVQVLPSGMQYKVIREGTGPIPKAGDTVTVKYRGALIDTTEFDNSEKHGNGTLTTEVSPDKVIAGWVDALKMMHTGAKWQLYIPSTLAYGDQAVGTDIGPGSTLVFDVELLSIKK